VLCVCACACATKLEQVFAAWLLFVLAYMSAAAILLPVCVAFDIWSSGVFWALNGLDFIALIDWWVQVAAVAAVAAVRLARCAVCLSARVRACGHQARHTWGSGE
jgi:hypothetical protein